MKTILITHKSKKGKKAMEQHLKETKKLSLREKMMFKVSGYKQKVEKYDPLTVALEINNTRFEQPMFIELIKEDIKKALKLNGAKHNTDYTLEVK